MKLTVSLAMAILLLVGSAPLWGQEGGNGATWAVVLGVEVYEDDTRIPTRAGAEQTTQAIFAYFVQPTHGNIGVEHARLVSGLTADMAAVESTFVELPAGVGEKDRLFVYIALRTAVAPDPEGAAPDKLRKYLLPFDADLDDLENSAFTTQQLTEWLTAIPAAQKILFLDAGFVGTLAVGGVDPNTNVGNEYLAALSQAGGVIAVTDGQKPIFEDPLNRPVLGFTLYTAMQGAGDNDRNGTLTMGELQTHIQKTRAAVYGNQGQWAPNPFSQGIPDNATLCAVPKADTRCPAGMRLVGEVCMDVYESPNQPGATVHLPGNWFLASNMCQQAGKRLCTPEEWIKACEGPGWGYPYGPQYRDQYCNIGNPDGELERVGSRPFCGSAWGIYDLIGNAQEWVGIGEKENSMVLGGRFRDLAPEMIRCDGAGIEANPILEGDDLSARCCVEPRG